jgi:hypothetical protein
MEKTKTFLLLMHLDADGSKSNLRKREMRFKETSDDFLHLYFPYRSSRQSNESVNPEIRNEEQSTKRTVITWAPTHIETGLLAELLCYANIINGLKLGQREALKTQLDIVFGHIEIVNFLEERIKEVGKEKAVKEIDERLEKCEIELELFLKFCGEKQYLMGAERDFSDFNNFDLESIFCFELSQDYIDYLKEVLKPYLTRK